MRGTALGPDEQRLRLSGGIAELLHGDTPASIFERADAALYRAKEMGKDRADIARAGEVRHGPGSPSRSVALVACFYWPGAGRRCGAGSRVRRARDGAGRARARRSPCAPREAERKTARSGAGESGRPARTLPAPTTHA